MSSRCHKWSVRSALHLLPAILAACGSGAAPAPPADPARRVEWPAVGGTAAGLRYSLLDDIDRHNVRLVRPAWQWKNQEKEWKSPDVGTPARPGSFEATPIMLGDTLYLSTPYSRAIALDGNTGRELWSFDPQAPRWGQIMGTHAGFVHRGVAVWTGPSGRRVLLTSRWRLFALDAATGRPIPTFGVGGEVDLTRDLRWPVDRYALANTSPPLVIDSLVVVGSAVDDHIVQDRDPPGDVQAFDVRTGRRVWRWSPVPAGGEPGSETWEEGSADRTGHVNVWTPMTADTARGLLYLAVSTPSNDFYGGRRKGDNLYAESLVCLDARTGKRVWHYQLVHHGLWDYDPPTPPALLTLALPGKSVDAVVVAGKTGFLYVFDRVTGAPVWPIEERPAPASDVPGERAAPTQPVPTRPAPFAKQGIGPEDLADFTPEIRARAEARVRRLRLGPLFTPPSLEGTVVLPGWIGGSGWGGMTADPETGIVYVKATNRPALGRVVPADSSRAGAGYTIDFTRTPDGPLDLQTPSRTGLLRIFGTMVRVPLVKPPYGTLTAYDLNRGDRLWQVTLGDTPAVRDLPQFRGLHLPPLGVAGAVGGMVTRGGLIFITGGGEVLYAMDKADGRVLAEWDLHQPGYSNPMTYRTAAGRQFVVVATGSGTSSRLQAFALPTGTAP
ncbi:MAG TPA: PQQ-binding-like beta-propeller repeat protein [Gemmatimonadales bacterium]|jgi:quinoprotein glucose dehydrogenase|nr:PQQ-binding-like beta-propeller repeat protein [Gemmatimonadales bacterium]